MVGKVRYVSIVSIVLCSNFGMGIFSNSIIQVLKKISVCYLKNKCNTRKQQTTWT